MKIKSYVWPIAIVVLLAIVTICGLVKYLYLTPPTHIKITGLQTSLSNTIKTPVQVNGEATIHKNRIEILVLNTEQDTLIYNRFLLTGISKDSKSESFKVRKSQAFMYTDDPERNLSLTFEYGLSKKENQAFFRFGSYELTGEIQ